MKRPHLILALGLAAAVVAAPTAQSAPQATPIKLTATVGPGFTINLTRAGKKVKTLKAGRYVITVRDRASSHNFHLRGPGSVNKNSGVAATGTRTWKVTLRRGTYRYVCDPHATMMKGSFRVT
jgi:plastocyanin